MTTGQRIRTLRIRAGLSQEQLAEKVGVSRQAVTKWELDRAVPSARNLGGLSRALGVSVASLTSQETQPQMQPVCDTAVKPRCMLHRRVTVGILVLCAYAAMNLAGRVISAFWYSQPQTLTGILFGTSPMQFPYLFGWLVKRHWFWICAAISVVLALLGKVRWAVISILGFAAGLLLGTLFGENPMGAVLGKSDGGWLIWGLVTIFVFLMGALMERFQPKDRRAMVLWSVGVMLGVILLTAMAVWSIH